MANRFFHAVINSKIRRLNINKIKEEDGTWLEDKDEIFNEVIFFFEINFHMKK